MFAQYYVREEKLNVVLIVGWLIFNFSNNQLEFFSFLKAGHCCVTPYIGLQNLAGFSCSELNAIYNRRVSILKTILTSG
jgi:hypothetical protein